MKSADNLFDKHRQLRRSQMLEFFQRLPPCLIGMEACASAHYWARELAKFGHEVRLMQPSYVKGYVKRGMPGSNGPVDRLKRRTPGCPGPSQACFSTFTSSWTSSVRKSWDGKFMNARAQSWQRH